MEKYYLRLPLPMKTTTTKIAGQLLDLHQRRAYPAEILISEGKIDLIREVEKAPARWILPGFVDAHVHIESSMLPPSGFAPLALRHGTLATVSDPHEIANVLGEEGVRWMAENGRNAPVHFHFGAPSCVPATVFETAGARLDAPAIRRLLEDETCHYLAEMMNWPGVLFGDAEVAEKISLAHALGVPVDGHAPGLRGEQAKTYFQAGIETDHECFTLEEAMEKAALGVKILIREGSAARNFEALVPLFRHYPNQILFCSDDKHPDDLLEGHINRLASRAIALGYDRFDVLRAACIHPVEHYRLPIGMLKPGDPADFVVVDSPDELRVLQSWRKGICVYEKGKTEWQPPVLTEAPNFFEAHFPDEDAYLPATSQTERTRAWIMDAIEGQLITKSRLVELEVHQGHILADPGRDILHLAVVNRYQKADPGLGFISGFGLKQAALASSVAHDSHNVVAVGSHSRLIKLAVDAVMREGGGIALASDEEVLVLPLPIAGLMSLEPGETVAQAYLHLTQLAGKLGSTPRAPFMLLSFMALLVIPELKLSDKGLFDGQKFAFRKLEEPIWTTASE